MIRPRQRLVLAWLIAIGVGLLSTIVLAVLLTPANRAYLSGHANHERVQVTGIDKGTHSCGRGTGNSVHVARPAAARTPWTGTALTCGHEPKLGSTVDIWHISGSRITLTDPRDTVLLAALILLVLVGSGVFGVRRVLRT